MHELSDVAVAALVNDHLDPEQPPRHPPEHPLGFRGAGLGDEGAGIWVLGVRLRVEGRGLKV